MSRLSFNATGAGVTLRCRRHGVTALRRAHRQAQSCLHELAGRSRAWLTQTRMSSGSRPSPATRRARCWAPSNGSAQPSRGSAPGWTLPACGDRRRVDADPGWAGQAPGADRGRLLLATSARSGHAIAVAGRRRRRRGLGVALGRERLARQLLARWRDAVTRSRVAVTAVLADGDLGQLVKFTDWDDAPSLRRVLVDIIEEYARHVGHADLIRESVDGLTGEDPPR